MDNTLENKEKFFAIYWGQFIGISNERTEEYRHVIDYSSIGFTDSIELKPLSSITDQDAIEVAKILCSKMIGENDKARVAKQSEKGSNRADKIVYIGSKEYTNYIVTVEELKVIANYNGWAGIQDNYTLSYAIDFIRSKGYALPWLNLQVEKQIEYDWVKIKESEVGNG